MVLHEWRRSFLEPDLFHTHIAFDPSLWWNNTHLVSSVVERLGDAHRVRTLYLSSSGQHELAELTGRLAELLEQHAGAGVLWK